MGINFDDVGGISGAVVLGEASHSALLQVLDPLDFSLKPIADVDGESRILGVEDVSLWASLEGVGMGFDKVLESVNSGIELAHFSCMVVFSLFNCFEQRFGDAL